MIILTNLPCTIPWSWSEYTTNHTLSKKNHYCIHEVNFRVTVNFYFYFYFLEFWNKIFKWQHERCSCQSYLLIIYDHVGGALYTYFTISFDYALTFLACLPGCLKFINFKMSADNWALTQAILGKLISKPPLKDNLLQRPPFRFIHDIVTR